MISKYKNVAVVYSGKGRKYADIFHKSISKISEDERYPICSRLIMESILTRELLSDAAAANRAFRHAAEYEKRVYDTSMQIWGGFLYYNMARTYVSLGDSKQAYTLFQTVIPIRERWLRKTSFHTEIRNALSFEYFLAQISYFEMCGENGILTETELQQEYELLGKQLEAYIEESNSLDTLVQIRQRLNAKKETLLKKDK